MDKKQRDRLIVISIMSYYARQIFAETKGYEFRKSPLKDCDLNKKIYVYSAKEDKALIGYMKVSDILKGNTNQILKATGYDVRPDGYEIVDYYGQNFQRCCALKFYAVTEFEEYLTLRDMRKINPSVQLPQYYSYIYENDPLYQVIKEWDNAFSLDGNLCENPAREKQFILKRAKERGRR